MSSSSSSSSSSSTLSSRILRSTPELVRAGCLSHILERDGVQIHYITSTPAKNVDTGITLVLVHGWPEFWYAWRHLIVSLTAVGYRIIACDLRGMGESRVLDPSRRGDVSLYSWRQQCLDIVKILDHEKIQHAVAIGHDWGGAVVWSLVRRFPTRFTGVISLCTPYRPRKKKYFSTEEVAKVLPIFWYQVMFKNHRLQTATELNRDVPYTINCLFRTSDRSDQYGKFPTSTSPSFLHHFPKTIPRSRLHTDIEYQIYVDMWKQATFNESLLWYATDRVNWEEENVAEDGKTLSVRVEQSALMITAGKDMVLKSGQSDGMEEWIPKLSRGHVEESAHWIMSEQPKQVHDIIVKWLQSTQSIHQSQLVSKL